MGITIRDSSVKLIDHMGSDLSVVNAARVSFAKLSPELIEQDIKLLNYLAKHNHWSPFSHVYLSFRIEAPIFVARQLVKHQVGLSWNEVSRRYVNYEPAFYLPKEWRGRPVKAKQGSSDEVINVSEAFFYEWPLDPNTLYGECLNTYNRLIKLGVAPEQARMVLPLSTMTEWIWSGSLYAFHRVCKLRLDAHAQKETADVAQYISQEAEKKFPESWRALNENQTTN